MFDLAAQPVWIRVGVAAVLVVAPTLWFLAGYRALERIRHEELVERMIEEGYTHPGLDDFLDQVTSPGPSTSNGTVTCASCDTPTHVALGNCHVCGERLRSSHRDR